MINKPCFTKFNFISIALLLLLAGCSDSEVSTQKQNKPRPVKLITIDDGSQSKTLTYPATIDTINSSKLAFQVSGKLEKLNVIAAQNVKKGDVIAALEQRNFVNEVKSSKIQFETANNDYQRGLKLAKDGVISQRDIEQLKSKKEVAESQYDSAQKALSDSKIIAPYDAIVAEVPVKQLENISAGQHVVTLFGKGEMEAVVNIPASIVATVDSKQNNVATVILQDVSAAPIPATFRRANLEADSASQTYEVRFSFAVPNNLNILPGMNASLKIERQTSSNATRLAVPTFAIFEENGQHFVWTVDQQTMQVSKTLVAIEQGIGEQLIITEGLKAGDVIVGAGANYVTEGMKVRPWTKA
ncbi:MAG: RND family efflux transporter MFP subunit [Pseudoalteromonas tetraodonis]|jgi:RND family efflux transporter MFP subunit|uniref:YknX-like C-terminal permuted SH3-like domain-containing protein n=2 Tax=Pseudoalteromonas TaxID=53246 RepID=A0ABN5C7S9_9GAMM|nr:MULTISPECIES: efflux RND transporter periplasmic adaptor subunit [Pseudoalteromonas]ALQ56811.1 Putative substrate binding periplasmic component of a multidrug resistance protein [Pseudoalteromonas issachenkonii]ATC92779.1 hypothetical protein PISS_b0677 [Pseudoalteromonas issachenkonii]KGK01688.1 efflux transporter, RND family, MFP subunit [Pseudoalteromonas sp. ND6B]QWF34643.1 efflux RND transporter periplasmic adaptor subunit [Pseudoalteromonas sp. SiA1]TMS63339.1 efflux RND transporter p